MIVSKHDPIMSVMMAVSRDHFNVSDVDHFNASDVD